MDRAIFDETDFLIVMSSVDVKGRCLSGGLGVGQGAVPPKKPAQQALARDRTSKAFIEVGFSS